MLMQPPLNEWILPGTPRCNDHLCNTHIFEALPEIGAVDRVPIPQQILWRRVPWKRLYDLLGSPVGRGIGRHIELDDPSAAMAEDHQYKQDPECRCWNREKID